MLSAPHPDSPHLVYFLDHHTGLLIHADNNNHGAITTVNESILPPVPEKTAASSLRSIISAVTGTPAPLINLRDIPLTRSKTALPENTPDFLTLIDIDSPQPAYTIHYTGTLPGCPYPCIIQSADITTHPRTHLPTVHHTAPFYWHPRADIPPRARNFIATRAAEYIHKETTPEPQ